MLIRDAHGRATLGGIPVRELLDLAGPGPAYLYDLDAIEAEARAIDQAFGAHPHLVAFAIKACSAGAVVRAAARGGAGAEVVSGGELEVALASGVAPDAIMMSGLAKAEWEIDRAIGAGNRGIFALQLESVEEIARVEARAASLGRRARVAIRVNPGVEADTHAHIATGHDEAKFGVALEDLDDAFRALDASANLDLIGFSSHIGSQLTETDEYVDAATKLVRLSLANEARAKKLEMIDFGGGFGVDYGVGCPAKPADFARAAVRVVEGTELAQKTIVVEPGRSLVAAHALLAARVVVAKRSRTGRRWLAIEAGMSDLVRPAMYGARHRIEPLDGLPAKGAPLWRVVGPVCESSDDFGEHGFDEPPPDAVLIRDAGAYGFTMASQYNGRALPAEVFVEGGKARVHRARRVEDWVRDRRAT